MTAACNRNPDLWMSEKPADVEAAKDGCLDCPLSRYHACRAEGWSHEYGVFGGLSGDDRRRFDPFRMARVTRARDAQAQQIDKAIIAARKAVALMVAEQAGPTVADPRSEAVRMLAFGASSRDVAVKLGVNRNTVRYWASRARTKPAA
ncbi:WhiB family transcriptional regulator [Micromonospora sp. WMMA1363]|uniref:WhiB family transcriptional regulator n=1 Tax=Micromonospora sp. WMMA1363 TaxID=3053985 RepID=UPI00259D21C0|nr:WhiB family transcriptional regulator [Micromonospora sp. WMMA1363]MDM4718419.1 WhiB family transcriptional regulator [Micromonospora sp. WMMA1363]